MLVSFSREAMQDCSMSLSFSQHKSTSSTASEAANVRAVGSTVQQSTSSAPKQKAGCWWPAGPSLHQPLRRACRRNST